MEAETAWRIAGRSAGMISVSGRSSLLNQSTSVSEYLTIEGERVPVEFRPGRILKVGGRPVGG